MKTFPRPPLPASTFTREWLRVNGISYLEFRNWLIEAGMAFASGRLWWGKGGRRPRAHEGIDLAAWLTVGGERRQVAAGDLIPVAYSGVVRTLLPDFIAASIWVRHGAIRCGPGTLHSVYAHVNPVAGLYLGKEVREGEVMASVAASTGLSGPPPHLHLSLAFVDDAVEDQALDWAGIHKSPGVHWIDPGHLLFPGKG